MADGRLVPPPVSTVWDLCNNYYPTCFPASLPTRQRSDIGRCSLTEGVIAFMLKDTGLLTMVGKLRAGSESIKYASHWLTHCSFRFTQDLSTDPH